MPATRLTKKYCDPIPEPDIRKAIIRERMAAKGHKMTYESLSQKVNISSDHLRKLMAEKPTEEWRPEIFNAVCKALSLDKDDLTMTAIYYHKLKK